MRAAALFVSAFALAASAGAAAADGAAPSDAQACDFFQAELIAVFCGHTAFVAPSGQGSDETINRTTTTAPNQARNHFGGGGDTTTVHYDYRDAYESTTLAISPWQGVRFHVTGEAFQYDYAETQHTERAGGFFGPATTYASVSGSYAGWQSIGAEATVWDHKTDAGRYVLDLVGGLEVLPGGGVYAGRDLQQIGWESGSEWRLGASGLSVDTYSLTRLQHYDNPGVVHLESESRLLLASDAYGVALGPRLESTSVLWHAAGLNTGWSETRLGGEALLAPFHRTAFPVLRDMTLDLIATHSIGQAALVPDWAGSASAYVYAATARFNFRF